MFVYKMSKINAMIKQSVFEKKILIDAKLAESLNDQNISLYLLKSPWHVLVPLHWQTSAQNEKQLHIRNMSESLTFMNEPLS